MKLKGMIIGDEEAVAELMIVDQIDWSSVEALLTTVLIGQLQFSEFRKTIVRTTQFKIGKKTPITLALP